MTANGAARGALFSRLELWVETRPRAAALNMAVDEALLRWAAVPVLRVYRWEVPAISIGYFQRWAECASGAGNREVVRRWTGGGMVEHGDDWTYALIIPAGVEAAGWRAVALYRRVHEALAEVLARDEPAVTLSAGELGSAGECFARPVRDDVVLDGRKIAGAAQRRTRAGVLHQGSVAGRMVDGGALAAVLAESWGAVDLAAEVEQGARQIAAERYATPEWLHRY